VPAGKQVADVGEEIDEGLASSDAQCGFHQ
jgi:hypothetical protein